MDGVGIEKYVDYAGAEVLANIQRAARTIYGLRVLHVNSTFRGGGVAMMLNCLIPLMNDVGINADWTLLYGDQTFSRSQRRPTMVFREKTFLSHLERNNAIFQ